MNMLWVVNMKTKVVVAIVSYIIYVKFNVKKGVGFCLFKTPAD